MVQLNYEHVINVKVIWRSQCGISV